MYPDKIAVKSGNEVVTYAQLNAMANRVARRIVSENGAEPEPVGLLIDKGVEQTAAMLGVLKAGKFFVLFDPSFPLERNSAIFEDTSPRLILVDAKNTPYGCKLTDTTSSLITFESIDPNSVSDDLTVKIAPDSLAYVVYTSGSTGQPKGVLQTHRSRLHFVMVYSKMLSLSPNDRCILLTSGTANTVANSLFALLNGAALHPINVNELGLSRLAGWIIDEKISICAISAPLFRNLCESLTGNEKFADLRVLRLTSEASYKSDFELYKRFFPRTCCLANMLAPTEAGILRQFLMDHETQISGDEIPLGYPVDDTEIFLLDSKGREVGCNEVGEIVVRSRYLSSGYWLRPELNKAKFKADPHEAGQRFYYTGDLGLMLPDGCLIHKGRKDFRVKIRGYGVEIGEVETVLRSHAAVKDCVVVDRKGDSGETKLIAYYTSSATFIPNTSELRKFLSRSLPDYMVPSMFVGLETIPLTPNGKLDRHALPEPGGRRPDLDIPFQPPRTDVETRVAQIFTECTGIERVGIDDNFFELGGDSLLFTRLLSRVSVMFQREFSIQELFEAPSVAGIARLLESPTQPAVVKAEPTLSLISKDTPVPLSYSQQRLWFLDQFDPRSFAYNLFAAFRLKGDLNVAALEQSFNAIIRRHEILRTVFQSENGNPIQVILPNLAIKMPLVDLRAIASEAARWTEARRMFTEEAQRPFDLATGPLVRITLLQLADDEYILLRAIHHIVCDGWSVGVLFHELSEIYEALSTGQPSPLADLPTQYGDYAKWQRQWFQDERLESQLSYWKEQLDNIATLQLPTDRPRRTAQAIRGARRYFAFSDALSTELKKLSHEHGATPFMTLLAAFQTLLHRYSNQTDVVIGSPVAGRTRKEFDELIGFFLNMLVLRLDLSADPTFAETIARARKVCLGALSHQELPFEKLVEELHPDRNLSHNPLFQVSFAFQNTPRFPPRLSGVEVEELEVDTGIARFDLHLFMEEMDGHLQGYCDYDSNLFNADTIERMLGHFQTLLQGIVADPNQRISDLPLLTEREKHQLLVEWNDTQTDFPKDKCIHQLFEEQVEKSPDAIALVFEDQQLSYRELNSRANQLAHYLRKRDVQPDSIVALCMNRSLELVIAILGVLKAGGAYMPIDPELPAQRLQFLLEDAQVRLLLTQDKLRSALADFAGHIVCLDSDWHKLADQSHEDPQHHVRGHHAAYVIYTSGSTGTPKGVVNVHDGLRNRIQWMQESYQLTSADRVLQKTPFTFDVSVWEFLWPLISGACLVVARPGGHRDSSYLVQLIQSQQITTLHFVPSMLEVFLQEPGAERCTSLRQVICSGEALSYELQQRFFERSTARLHNLYGPTEASIDVTAWECRKDSDLRIVPIGQPIANTQIHILNVNLQPAPIGVTGQLHIGGVGLARGYLNRPELTAEKFITDPFSQLPGARLYKTGDLARYLPDGNIEFLGRIDDQVKIRGFRIELGEIESVLAQHPAIQQAVVLATEDTPGDKRLVAYSVATDGSAPSAHDLCSYLQQKLPEYMVPSAFVFLDSLPLTPNGKLDRKSLPAPDPIRPELEKTFTAPRTPKEEMLAKVWAEVLKIDKVGVNDNFFGLGGHSLLATQLISRIRNDFRIDLPLRTLFESPTVAGIAEHLESTCRLQTVSSTLPVLLEARDEGYPLSFAQERFWFLDQLQPNNLAYSIGYGFNLDGPLNVNALEQAISEIVTRHEALRTTFHQRNGRLVQMISEQWSFRLSNVDLSTKRVTEMDAEVQRIFESDRRRGFDLSADLLLRATLLRLGENKHVLILTSHHIAWDHWCIEVFFRELSALYQAFANGKPTPLSAPRLQYKHYALWQRNAFRDEEAGRHLAYWKQQLADAPRDLHLPTDYPRKPLQNRRGVRQTLILPEELNNALRSLSREAGVTLFMTYLAAFQTLLNRITGQDDIVVGTPIAGRNLLETEKLIGLFLNTLALRTNLSDDPSFLKLLTRVRDLALGAYDHQDIPFERLVEELQPERVLTHTPLFQVFINMYNFKEATLELDRLSVKRLPVGESGEQFDLTFTIREDADGTHLTFGYDAELFEHSTIRRMLGHFETLLEGIVEDPARCISDLPLLSDAEKQQLLIEWNDTRRDYPKDQCVHELFETQVEKTPDAVALRFEDRQLTYRELNGRANQLAHYLIKLGVCPEMLVGICVERSIEMIVGLLGILKAGGAYVPLDPSYPKDRLKLIMNDSQISVLLVNSGLGEKSGSSKDDSDFPSVVFDTRIKRVCLDRDRPVIEQESRENLTAPVQPGDLAYVIYTSGSTGTPKGVAIEHRQTGAFLSWAKSVFNQDELCGVLASTSICFDLSVFEIFAPLSSGGTVIVAQNALALTRLPKPSTVSLVNTVPSAMNELLNLAAIPESVLVINLAGEPLRTDLVRRIYESSSVRKVYDLYGPSECTTYSTWTCRTPDGPQTIGRPITNTQVYLLDSGLNPVPIGTVGEIYIGGNGVARGYLNRPELTAEKFIADPFSDQPGARLYKTGDLARHLPDGNIVFLGRSDHQVKIRGYRIELGEIESVLAQHPAIQQAVVLAREDTSGDCRLMAYAVNPAGLNPSAQDLRRFLQQKLPEYMVPSTFVFLDSLPLTANGKLDRRALPAPDQSRPELDETFIAPTTPVEGILANIWAEVLRLDKVGVHDNFFELGGHSLLATQIVSRIRSTFSIDLALRSLFESPTVAEMAVIIIENQAKRATEAGLTDILGEVEATTEEEVQKTLATYWPR